MASGNNGKADALHAELLRTVSVATVADIEGLDHASVGFCRGACEAGIPEEERGDFNPLKRHLFVSTALRPVEWGSKAENVPGYAALCDTFSSDKSIKVTAIFANHAAASAVPFSLLVDGSDEAETGARILEYSGGVAAEPGEVLVPWLQKGVLVTNRSAETFVFVCSHRTRDARCGYCGPILVDLLRAAFIAALGAEGAARIRVYACSHVGGHKFAGNVLVYSKAGGVGFGCVTPQDVNALAAFVAVASDGAPIPAELEPKLRGRMAGAKLQAQ